MEDTTDMDPAVKLEALSDNVASNEQWLKEQMDETNARNNSLKDCLRQVERLIIVFCFIFFTKTIHTHTQTYLIFKD